MADETNHLLKRLTLTGAEGEEVSFGIKDEFSVQLGSENWAVGKLITDVAFNRDALVRVFKNVWYTDDEKDYEPSFSLLRGAVGEVMAIDWRDREGGWGEYIRVRVWLDITKPLQRVVKMGTQTGPLNGMEEADLQFGEWLRVPLPKRPRQRPSKTGKSASHRDIEVVEGAKGDGSSSSKGPANGTRVNALKFEVGVESQVKSDDKGSSTFEGTEPPSCDANDALKQQVKGKDTDDGTQGLEFRGIPKLNPSKQSSGDF
ncbi:hypothetical protein GOBAR_AA27072 [Gossypium barbadense]|uniref:DUF4283 domain-containing protein n=1 Tax=Gossypium barbadense TaxID=3634 RepID=A0A2P5WR87_GOSBA|nr:hypothetical protein GOBAR_AA27072 [Gossypium barbadense]